MENIKSNPDLKLRAGRLQEIYDDLIYKGKKLELRNRYHTSVQSHKVIPIIRVKGETKSEEFVLDCVQEELLETYVAEQLDEPIKEISVVGYTTATQGTSQKLDYVYWDKYSNSVLAHIENTDNFVSYEIGLFDVDYVKGEFHEKPQEQIVKLLFVKNDLDSERMSGNSEPKTLPYRIFHKSLRFPKDMSRLNIISEIQKNEKAFTGYNILVTIDDEIEQPSLISANMR